ncbi:MAG TPA: nucleoside recognition domain-containing protein [Burkholderiales bacterium]|nr:nucleoside recognition domain-containing protein [Burkholderiales bacterium]
MKAVSVPLRQPLFRGEKRLRIALVGLPGAGTTTIFRAVESTATRLGRPGAAGDECDVDIGFDEARITRVPSLRLAHDPQAIDVIVQVLDATALERHLEFTLELLALGRPLVLVMNRMDQTRRRGLHVSTGALARQLRVPVVATIATMGYGIRELFGAAADAARRAPAVPQPALGAAALAELATRPAGVRERRDWRYWLDELFLSPRWGLLGSVAVFAAVLFVVFYVSVWIDARTTAQLAATVSAWQPDTTAGVVVRAVVDGLVGLIGIVVPYMVPLVLLLIVLEQTGIMARIAFAVDRVFHRLGLHGGVALPLLLGLGCNVPALSTVGATTKGAERTTASLLVTFVPCSARSAIILALAGKYLGVWGVFAVFAVAGVVISAMGHLLRRRFAAESVGQILEIPGYAAPRWGALARETWLRTRDILTIVTPLLVGGSVVLALLAHWGADRWINLALAPVTAWWLGLPVVLGVPLLFGVLRKELSLAMIYTALGGFAVDAYLSSTQIFTFLVFLTLYVPCISTFAVMTKTIGRRQALASVALSVAVALAVSGVLRFALEGLQRLAA